MSEVNLQKMSELALETALKIDAMFPGLPPRDVGKLAKFIVMSAEAIKASNESLADSGKELSVEGYELVFTEVANHIFK